MSVSARDRWEVFSRVVAAVVAGYALTNLITIVLPLLLHAAGWPLATVMLAAQMASFLIWSVVIMAVFHARTATWAWLWLLGACMVLLPVTWLLLPTAAA